MLAFPLIIVCLFRLFFSSSYFAKTKGNKKKIKILMKKTNKYDVLVLTNLERYVPKQRTE